MSRRVIEVVAVARDGAIGHGNGLPWPRLREDMAHFRATTMGHWVVMGSRTFETLPTTLLPGRTIIVLTRDVALATVYPRCVHSVAEALALVPDGEALYVCGGAQVYEAFGPHITQRIVTHIDAVYPDADTHRSFKDGTVRSRRVIREAGPRATVVITDAFRDLLT